MNDRGGRIPGIGRLKAASRRHQATDVIRAAIVAGRLRPGERLIETDLAERLGISRAPIREALRDLEHEGLVASRPYKATEVLGVTQTEIEEILVPIRLTLERFAFRQAAPHITAEDLEGLEHCIAVMRVAGEIGDAEALADADVRFHELVVVRAGHPHCEQLWRTIEPRVRGYFTRDAPAHHDPRAVAEQHQQLLNALLSGDERRLLDEVDRHIRLFLTAPDVGEGER